MNKRIIYQTEDGGTAVVIPSPDCGLTVEEIAAKDVPKGVKFQIVDVAAIPADRLFRRAWKCGAGRVDVDMAKAKDVAHDLRREARAKEFAPLDEKIAKQLPGDDLAVIEGQRVDIRRKYDGIQTEIDGAVSVEELVVKVMEIRGA